MVLTFPRDHIKAEQSTRVFRNVREHNNKIKMSKLLEEHDWFNVSVIENAQEKSIHATNYPHENE